MSSVKNKLILLSVFFVSAISVLNIDSVKTPVKDAILQMLKSPPVTSLYVKIFRNERPYDDDHVITTLVDGSEIIVNKHDKCVCWFIRISGRWDKNEMAALQHIVKPGDNIIEVGANFGVNTLMMSKLTGDAGKIVAFEPNPNVYGYLEKSLDLNKMNNVEVKRLAAGGIERTASMALSTLNIGGSYIIGEQLESKIKIKVVRLDDAVKMSRVDILKIDAEGSEEEIIDGAHDIINSNKDITIVMEWSKDQILRQGGDPARFMEKIKKYGFNIWHIGQMADGKAKFEPINANDLLSIEYGDIVLKRSKEL